MILFCFRSDENGNCLFSAFSNVMSRGSKYVHDWKILASIELYLNLEFYANHPSLVKVMNSHSGVFSKIETLLALSVSYFALDSGKTKMELLKEEALSICNPIRWSGVLCVLDLSSVFFVHCFYKSYEAMLKYKIMFNELIKPRKCPSFNSNIVYFLFCSNTLRVPIFAIFANFGQFRKIKYPRNLYRDRIRKNLYPRKKVWHFKFQ